MFKVGSFLNESSDFILGLLAARSTRRRNWSYLSKDFLLFEFLQLGNCLFQIEPCLIAGSRHDGGGRVEDKALAVFVHASRHIFFGQASH